MLLPMHVSQVESRKGGLTDQTTAWMTSSIGMLLKYAHEVDKALDSWALILRNDRSLVVNFLYAVLIVNAVHRAVDPFVIS